jgi:hypothetical protein
VRVVTVGTSSRFFHVFCCAEATVGCVAKTLGSGTKKQDMVDAEDHPISKRGAFNGDVVNDVKSRSSHGMRNELTRRKLLALAH